MPAQPVVSSSLCPTPRSSGRPQARFACLRFPPRYARRPPLNALVRRVSASVNVKATKLQDALLLILVAGPVVGLLLGGIYSWPAIQLTKGREPWLTLLLAAGLAITVFGIGQASDASLFLVCGGWMLAVFLLLVVRRVQGAPDHNLERFGMVHALALIASLGIMYFTVRHAAPTHA